MDKPPIREQLDKFDDFTLLQHLMGPRRRPTAPARRGKERSMSSVPVKVREERRKKDKQVKKSRKTNRRK